MAGHNAVVQSFKDPLNATGHAPKLNHRERRGLRAGARDKLTTDEYDRFVQRFRETQKVYRDAAPDAAREMVNLALNAEDERVRGTMASMIVERAWGRPREYDPNAEGPPKQPFRLNADLFTVEELEQIYAIMEMMAKRQGIVP